MLCLTYFLLLNFMCKLTFKLVCEYFCKFSWYFLNKPINNRFFPKYCPLFNGFWNKERTFNYSHHNFAMQKWLSELKRGFLVTKFVSLNLYILFSTVKIMVVWVWIYPKNLLILSIVLDIFIKYFDTGNNFVYYYNLNVAALS